jgi:hypothetical protein
MKGYLDGIGNEIEKRNQIEMFIGFRVAGK